MDKLIHDLDAEPQPVVTTSGLETVITGVEVRVATLDPLYAPLDHFEGLATLLDDAMQGNYTFLVQRIGFSRKVDLCSSSEVLEYTWMDDANMAVRCGDGKDATDYDLSYWESYVQRLKGLSPDIGDLWAEGTFSCSGWQIRPKYHFGGPFTSPEADASIRPGRPSAPLLLLSSLYDPVTPLRSANKAAQGHPGSRVLTQKSVGHCAFLSSPSGCTKGYIREYMETGKMPSEGTECEADCVPWEDCPFEKAQLPR